MTDPCKSIVKEAKKKSGKLLSKDYWSGALLYIQAAECYKSSMNKEKAFELAMKAAENLKKYASKYGYELVIGDIEKALKLAYTVAPKDKKETVKLELFNTLNMHAKQLEISGNQLQAAEIYKKSIEFAPSGETAKDVLLHAINILETTAQQKAMQGKDKLFEKLTEKAEELRMLLPEEPTPTEPLEDLNLTQETPINQLNTTPKSTPNEKEEETETITKVYVYTYDHPLEETIEIVKNNVINPLRNIGKIKISKNNYAYTIELKAIAGNTEIQVEIQDLMITITLTGNKTILEIYEEQILKRLETTIPKIKLEKTTTIE